MFRTQLQEISQVLAKDPGLAFFQTFSIHCEGLKCKGWKVGQLQSAV